MIVFATPPPCGDGVVELDEECDDGNTYGGDGCAANCTLETQRPFPFDRSAVLSIQTAWLQILLPLSGEEIITTGSSRPIDETGQIPAVIHTNDLRVDPVSVPGLVCLCVTGMDDPELGPGIGGQGTIGCGPSGLTDVDYLNSQDHDIDDVDPGCASGTIESVAHPGVCNGPPQTVRSGGTAPRGSALFLPKHRAHLAERFRNVQRVKQINLQRATEIAVEMVTKYGMDPGVGQRTYAPRPQAFLPAMQDMMVSAAEATGREIDLAVRQLVEAGDACARQVLEKRRADLEAGVELLIAHESLTAEQFAPLRSSGATGSGQAAA